MFNEQLYSKTVLNPTNGRGVTDDHRILTPQHLISDLLNHIDLAGKQILVICTVEMVYELAHRGINSSNVWFYSPCNLKNRLVKAIMPNATVISKPYEAFAEHDFGMRDGKKPFDVVVGNPPYQKGNNKRFYRNFVEKARELSDRVAFVIPATYFNEDASRFVDEKVAVFRYLGEPFMKLDGKKVNQKVCYYVTDPCRTATTLIDLAGNKTTDVTPVAAVSDTLDDYRVFKSVAVKDGLESQYSYDSDLKRCSDATGVACVVTTGNNGVGGKLIHIPHKFKERIKGLGLHKVVLSGVAGNEIGELGDAKYYGPQYGCCGAVFIAVANKNEALNLISFLETAVVKALVRVAKSASNTNSQAVFSAIPKIDLTRSWTDEELYEHFNLTEEEIDHIKSSY